MFTHRNRTATKHVTVFVMNVAGVSSGQDYSKGVNVEMSRTIRPRDPWKVNLLDVLAVVNPTDGRGGGARELAVQV